MVEDVPSNFKVMIILLLTKRYSSEKSCLKRVIYLPLDSNIITRGFDYVLPTGLDVRNFAGVKCRGNFAGLSF